MSKTLEEWNYKTVEKDGSSIPQTPPTDLRTAGYVNVIGSNHVLEGALFVWYAVFIVLVIVYGRLDRRRRRRSMGVSKRRASVASVSSRANPLNTTAHRHRLDRRRAAHASTRAIIARFCAWRPIRSLCRQGSRIPCKEPGPAPRRRARRACPRALCRTAPGPPWV